MVVGFVNSGFMTLAQAIGVIMELPTSARQSPAGSWYSRSAVRLPDRWRYDIFYLFAKRDRLRYSALATLGLGLVFMGLELMKNSRDHQRAAGIRGMVHGIRCSSYSVFYSAPLVGCIRSLHRSVFSTTLGITIGRRQIGVIQFETACTPRSWGENVGT